MLHFLPRNIRVIFNLFPDPKISLTFVPWSSNHAFNTGSKLGFLNSFCSLFLIPFVLLNSYLYFPNSKILQTGGLAEAATSTKSRPWDLAIFNASSGASLQACHLQVRLHELLWIGSYRFYGCSCGFAETVCYHLVSLPCGKICIVRGQNISLFYCY